jgi:hypothetical protein
MSPEPEPDIAAIWDCGETAGKYLLTTLCEDSPILNRIVRRITTTKPEDAKYFLKSMIDIIPRS